MLCAPAAHSLSRGVLEGGLRETELNMPSVVLSEGQEPGCEITNPHPSGSPPYCPAHLPPPRRADPRGAQPDTRIVCLELCELNKAQQGLHLQYGPQSYKSRSEWYLSILKNYPGNYPPISRLIKEQTHPLLIWGRVIFSQRALSMLPGASSVFFTTLFGSCSCLKCTFSYLTALPGIAVFLLCCNIDFVKSVGHRWALPLSQGLHLTLT